MASSKVHQHRWYKFVFRDQATADEWIPKLEAAKKKITPPKGYRQSVSRMMLMDYDQEFALDPDPNVIPAGFENSEGKEVTLDDIEKQMFQMSDGSLNYVCTCKCGKLRGNYHRGTVCPTCHTVCKDSFTEKVNFGGWLEIPKELPPMLHPVVYRVLRKWMGKMFKQSTYLLDAILDPDQVLPEPYRGVIGQGLIYLSDYNNFRDVINFVAQQRKGTKSKDFAWINEFLDAYKYCTFVRHIPILNQSLHVLTQSGTMMYNDDSSEFILQTYLELSNTIYTYRHRPDMRPEYLAGKLWNVFSSWMQYVDSIIDPKLSGKKGFIRKNMLGNRMHASSRAVIAPITRNHDADAIEIPWRMIVGVYKLEIMNILQRRYGRDVNYANDAFDRAIVTYDSEIDSCLKTLLNECPFKGFPFLMGRNPC